MGVVSKKLYQQVAGAVGEAIRRGEYAAGTRLPSERELAEKFGVSRPTVREAMIALEIQGFLEIRHGSGIHITAAAPKIEEGADLDVGPFELTEARMALEGECCALAATAITDGEIAALNELLHQMATAVTAPGAPGSALRSEERVDRAFHLLIAEATRNAVLVKAIEMLWDLRYSSPLCVEVLGRAYDAGDRPRIDEHRRIVQALAARDPKASRAAMRDHLARVIEGLLITTENDTLRQAQEAAAARRDSFVRRASV